MTLLTKAEQDQVAAAITAVEKDTDAELVTVLAARADNYAYIPVLWAGLLALVVPGSINYLAGLWPADTLLLVQWAVFVLLNVIFRIPAVTTRLIPQPVRHWRAGNLARRQFLEQNLHRTEGATGMLIFVSEAERFVEILVDQGISSRLDDATWEDIVTGFTRQVRQGNTLAGFLDCIEACGRHLKQAVPATHERNELSNRLVIID